MDTVFRRNTMPGQGKDRPAPTGPGDRRDREEAQP
jgi:hypothetical protein